METTEKGNVSVLTTIEDTVLTAFLKLKGHTIHPWIMEGESTWPKRVSFEVLGDPEEIEANMQQFYNNEQVGIQDFNRCFKEIKSAMYNLRRITTEKEK